MKKLRAKLIFLDIDGVLNSGNSVKSKECPLIDDFLIGISPTLKGNLNKIVKLPNVFVILSSTWRQRQELKEHLYNNKIYFIGITPGGGGDRAKQIKQWLANPVYDFTYASEYQKEYLRNKEIVIDDYVIIDDSYDADIPGHYYQTLYDDGLTTEITNQILERLKS